MKNILFFAAFLSVFGGILLFFNYTDIGSKPKPKSVSQKSEKPVLLKWRLLNEYNHNNNTGPEELMALDGKLVKMPAYVVPLTDSYKELDEFLMVPDAQSCVHVPPPPPNLIVHVKMNKPVPADGSLNPAWVTGIFRIKTKTSKYGAAAYQMEGQIIEKFDY